MECDTSNSGWAIYNWADDQPSRVPGNLEDCVYILGADGYYYDDRCDVAKKYICETIPGTFYTLKLHIYNGNSQTVKDSDTKIYVYSRLAGAPCERERED